MNEEYATQERLKYIKQRLKENSMIVSNEIIMTILDADEEYTDMIITQMEEE